MMRRAFAFIMIASFPVLLSGCGRPKPSERFVRPDQVTDFHVLYGRNCSGCHGSDGQLGPGPPLNDPLFLAIISDDQLASLIREGRDATLMPAFARSHGGSLTEKQVKILAKGIRENWGKAITIPTSQLPAYQVSASDPAGVTRGDVARGKITFAATCADCHGDEGKGGDDGSISDQALGTLLSDQFLRRIIITGRPDLEMPNYSECGEQSSLSRPLTPEEIIDIAAYVRSLQRPSGAGRPPP